MINRTKDPCDRLVMISQTAWTLRYNNQQTDLGDDEPLGTGYKIERITYREQKTRERHERDDGPHGNYGAI